MVSGEFSNWWNQVIKLANHRSALNNCALTKIKFEFVPDDPSWVLFVSWSDKKSIAVDSTREEQVLFDAITLLTKMVEGEEVEARAEYAKAEITRPYVLDPFKLTEVFSS